MKRINLDKAWEIRFKGLECGPEKSNDVLIKKDGWLQADLPCDIHMPLIENGIIIEPLEEDNSYACEWTEDKSWWCRKNRCCRYGTD